MIFVVVISYLHCIIDEFLVY